MADSCTKMRRKLVNHCALNISNGAIEKIRSEWVTGPCNVPLFGDSKAGGLCRGCAGGWTHPENYPVEP